ncbi:hypothetical protein [Natronomonas amylolytica]|uniref:hypothetical protein n=1 Tax=Natronomonas amylolytica TaxID=3108498 RepID=UPI00300B1373
MNNTELERVHELLSDSRSKSADIDKLHALYYIRRNSDYEGTLDGYLQDKKSDESSGGILSKLSKNILSSDGDSRNDHLEQEPTILEDKLFNNFINKLSDNISEETIHYIFRARPEMKMSKEIDYDTGKSEVIEKSEEGGDWDIDLSDYSRIIVTNKRILVFTLSHRISELSKSSEWVLSAEIPFVDIEEILYYKERSERATLTTEDRRFHVHFYSDEPQQEKESAIDYIGQKSDLEPRLELSRDIDNSIFHGIKDNIFDRKDNVQYWRLSPQNENGVAWGIERGLDLTEIEESQQAHKDAAKRAPPVDIGDVRKMGVFDITPHHQRGRDAVCEVEGFKIFVQDIPEDIDTGDIILAKVLSYNKGESSAKAMFIESRENS